VSFECCVDAVARVEWLLNYAIARGASDIHGDPTEFGLRLRIRRDGLLEECAMLDVESIPSLIARLKVLAHCDVTERRLPQDGKFSYQRDSDEYDCRVATFPVIHGESFVVRLLPRSAQAADLDMLGMSAVLYEHVVRYCNRSRGFLLVTGPTGSGKTTTVYAVLKSVITPQKQCVTLEDPVEYRIAGASQGEINPSIGFTFDVGLRALIRQDPDILMVGEIRDPETARVALHGALTGHMMVSTFHAGNAPQVLSRLLDMGVEPYLVAAALDAIIAQRLVRKLCVVCRKPDTAPVPRGVALDDRLRAIPRFSSVGCDACDGTGYRGRTALFEFIELTDEIRSILTTAPHPEELYAAAQESGWSSLYSDGCEKVAAGITSLDELIRVIN
jgi:type II secretory ATPase GspE/PulE/Tfp pilus assembly ATPase PilB-like protein